MGEVLHFLMVKIKNKETTTVETMIDQRTNEEKEKIGVWFLRSRNLIMKKEN